MATLAARFAPRLTSSGRAGSTRPVRHQRVLPARHPAGHARGRVVAVLPCLDRRHHRLGGERSRLRLQRHLAAADQHLDQDPDLPAGILILLEANRQARESNVHDELLEVDRRADNVLVNLDRMTEAQIDEIERQLRERAASGG